MQNQTTRKLPTHLKRRQRACFQKLIALKMSASKAKTDQLTGEIS